MGCILNMWCIYSAFEISLDILLWSFLYQWINFIKTLFDGDANGFHYDSTIIHFIIPLLLVILVISKILLLRISTSIIDKALALSDCFFMIIFKNVNLNEWYFWFKEWGIVKILHMCCKIASQRAASIWISTSPSDIIYFHGLNWVLPILLIFLTCIWKYSWHTIWY